MSNPHKDQKEILKKLGIETLNAMQKEAIQSISSHPNSLLLSPTGTGKTLAFLLPIIANLNDDCREIQCLILVPARELSLQIEQVVRSMGSGFKVHAVYGGRSSGKDKMDLKHPPAILIGTPGRVASHLRNDRFSTKDIKTLVLDEFDKSLEAGFTDEMSEIISLLPSITKRILTSATQSIEIPSYVKLHNPNTINHLQETKPQLEIQQIISPDKDKLETLFESLCFLGNKPGIIFCNFRDAIERISSFLHRRNIQHGCFHGGMEQRDRETALIKFRNGTHQLLIATDLAARGIDIPQIKYIIHYHLPAHEHEFTHRNGRTARMFEEGTAYVLRSKAENLPEFIPPPPVTSIKKAPIPTSSKWKTLCITGGRRNKISKGDIVGLFFKKGNILSEQIGLIEVQQQYSFVAVHGDIAEQLIQKLNRQRLKKTKIRINIV